jgi:hypothetical protein
VNRPTICAVVKNEGIYISEWIAFHCLQGVNNFLIFDNQSTDGTKQALAQIARHTSVWAIDWPGDNYHEMQLSAYVEGAKRLIGQADWAAFIDIDEFIFSSRNRSLPEELELFGPEVSAIAIGHRIFGSSGQITYQSDLVTSRFVRCARPDHPQSQWFKTIVRPALVDRFDSAHSVILKAGSYLLADHSLLRCTNAAWHPGDASSYS